MVESEYADTARAEGLLLMGSLWAAVSSAMFHGSLC
jgi:hypothetical protein